MCLVLILFLSALPPCIVAVKDDVATIRAGLSAVARHQEKIYYNNLRKHEALAEILITHKRATDPETKENAALPIISDREHAKILGPSIKHWQAARKAANLNLLIASGVKGAQLVKKPKWYEEEEDEEQKTKDRVKELSRDKEQSRTPQKRPSRSGLKRGFLNTRPASGKGVQPKREQRQQGQKNTQVVEAGREHGSSAHSGSTQDASKPDGSEHEGSTYHSISDRMGSQQDSSEHSSEHGGSQYGSPHGSNSGYNNAEHGIEKAGPEPPSRSDIIASKSVGVLPPSRRGRGKKRGRRRKG